MNTDPLVVFSRTVLISMNCRTLACRLTDESRYAGTESIACLTLVGNQGPYLMPWFWRDTDHNTPLSISRASHSCLVKPLRPRAFPSPHSTMIPFSTCLLTLVCLSAAATQARAHHDHPLPPTTPAAAKNASGISHVYSRSLTLSTFEDFLDFFTFNNIKDPSGGLVTYVDQKEAERLDLVGPGKAGGIRISADPSEKNVSAGRKSIRLRGKEAFGVSCIIATGTGNNRVRKTDTGFPLCAQCRKVCSPSRSLTPLSAVVSGQLRG